MKAMITDVEKITGVSAHEILGYSQTQRISLVRQLYWKLLHDKKEFSYTTIAKITDRTRSGICRGVLRANDLLEIGDRMATDLWEQMKEIE